MQAILISIISVLGAGLIGFITTVVHGLRSDNAQLRNEHANLRTETKTDNADLRTELKADNAELRAEFKADNAKLRAELKADNAKLRAEFKADNAKLRAELKADNAELRAELKADNAELRAELSKLADLVHDLANKMVTAMAELEVRLSDKISAEIRSARESTVGQ